MYAVWFCDLKKAIKALQKACPSFVTFTSIHGNMNGDFVIKHDENTYIVKHSDFSVWRREGGDWKTSTWIRVD